MKVALVTTTFSKNAEDLRFQLALKTCQEARKAGYPLYIVDGSPDPNMRTLLLEAGATAVAGEEIRGMGASRRQCFQMGLDSGAEVIVWLEPEKYPFVSLIGPCAEMIGEGEGKYDIILPSRKSLQSYPRYQELSELRAIRNIGIITRRPDLDWMFGPRVMSRKGTELLMSYTGQSGGDTWELLNIPLIWAFQSGIKVGSKLVDYIHPPEQTAAEEGDEIMDRKRDLQRDVLEKAIGAECHRLGLQGLQ